MAGGETAEALARVGVALPGGPDEGDLMVEEGGPRQHLALVILLPMGVYRQLPPILTDQGGDSALGEGPAVRPGGLSLRRGEGQGAGMGAAPLQVQQLIGQLCGRFLRQTVGEGHMDPSAVAFLPPGHLRPAVQAGKRHPRLALRYKAVIGQPFGVNLVPLLQGDAVGVNLEYPGGQLMLLQLRTHQVELQQQVLPLAHPVQLAQPVPLGPLVGLLHYHDGGLRRPSAGKEPDDPLDPRRQGLIVAHPQHQGQTHQGRRQPLSGNALSPGPLRRRQGILHQIPAGGRPVKQRPIVLFRHSSSAPFHASCSRARPRES